VKILQDPTYGTPASYGALRLDLGGVLLGAIIGLGASLFIPKLLHGAGSPHDHYRRGKFKFKFAFPSRPTSHSFKSISFCS